MHAEGIEGMMAGGADGLHASLADHVDPLLGVVLKFNASLLAAEAGGKNTLASRLVAVIQVCGVLLTVCVCVCECAYVWVCLGCPGVLP